LESAFDFREGVEGARAAAGEGALAWPNTGASDSRDLGARAVRLLLSDSGRGFGVLWRFWARESGFLMVDTGRAVSGVRMGVVVGVATPALTVRFPGAVIDSLLDAIGAPRRLGVAGIGWGGPSLVVGRLLLLDKAEAGRRGGPMLLSAAKKLERRRVLLAAGDDGSCDRLSTVLSDNDGRDFFLGAGCGANSEPAADSASGACSGSLSRKPSLDSAWDEAREADRKPSSWPSVSSSW